MSKRTAFITTATAVAVMALAACQTQTAVPAAQPKAQMSTRPPVATLMLPQEPTAAPQPTETPAPPTPTATPRQTPTPRSTPVQAEEHTATALPPATHRPATKTTTGPTELAPFLGNLSDEERACLPDGADSYAAVLEMLEREEAKLSEIMGCLTDDNQYRLFLAMDEKPLKPLSEETRRCVWRGHKPLVFIVNPEPEPTDEAFSRVLVAMFIGPPAILAYCLKDDEFANHEARHKPNEEERRLFNCLVDHAGGIEPFINWLIREDDALERLEQNAHRHCDEELETQ